MATTARRTDGRPPRLALLVVVAALGACSPALDWREARPEGTGVTMLFPCRPERHERPVRLAEETVALRLHSCTAADAAFALAAVEVADPARVTPLLAALRAQAVANLDGTASDEAAPPLPGATPNGQSARLRIVGRRPDGRPVVEHAVFFVKGRTLFQATVLGTDGRVDRDAIDTFFGSIRLP